MPQDSLPKLGPVYEPDPLDFQFETPGWYIVGGLLLIGIFILTFVFIRNYRKKAYRRDAAKYLRKLDRDKPDISTLQEVLAVLKKVALQTFGREKVAGLYGKNWLEFLQQTSKSNHWNNEFEILIREGVYASRTLNLEKKNINEFINWSEDWILHHARKL